jgi:hypothetical protein
MSDLDDPALLTAMRSYLRAIDDLQHLGESAEAATVVDRAEAVSLARLALYQRLEAVGWRRDLHLDTTKSETSRIGRDGGDSSG